MRRGLGLIPRSRRDEGLLMGWSVARNMTLVILERLRSRLRLLGRRRERERAAELVARWSVATDSLEKGVGLLSGGNQQKVVLAKWLAAQPKILLLQDPTRGIDVGSKAEIYRLCQALAAQGLGILFSSSEIEETLGLCDRVLVLRHGKVVQEHARGAASKAEVLQAMVAGRAGRSQCAP